MFHHVHEEELGNEVGGEFTALAQAKSVTLFSFVICTTACLY